LFFLISYPDQEKKNLSDLCVLSEPELVEGERAVNRLYGKHIFFWIKFKLFFRDCFYSAKYEGLGEVSY